MDHVLQIINDNLGICARISGNNHHLVGWVVKDNGMNDTMIWSADELRDLASAFLVVAGSLDTKVGDDDDDDDDAD